MRVLIMPLLILTLGCGYHLQRASAGVWRLGHVEDLSPEGDLGLLANRWLEIRAQGVGPELCGRVALGPERPLGFDSGGAALYEVEVKVSLWLTEGGGPVWVGDEQRGRAIYLRGDTGLGTSRNRRHALEQALDDVLTRATLHLPDELESP